MCTNRKSNETIKGDIRLSGARYYSSIHTANMNSNKMLDFPPLSDQSLSSNSRTEDQKQKSMEVGARQMQNQWSDYIIFLIIQGFVDEQFLQLKQLHDDESNPDFVNEVVSLFIEDSERILNDLNFALDYKHHKLDYKIVDAHVHQLKDSSSSIGALRVTNSCIAFHYYCEEQNIRACLRCLEQVQQEYFFVKQKLETMFRLEQQIVAAGGSIPVMELMRELDYQNRLGVFSDPFLLPEDSLLSYAPNEWMDFL